MTHARSGLSEMIVDDERKKAAENKVKLQTRKEDEHDALMLDLLQRGKDLAAEGEEEEEREPFFLYCPPVEPEAHLRCSVSDAPVTSQAELQDLIRDLAGGVGHRVPAPLSVQTRAALATLAVFHGEGGVRDDCRKTLCADLGADRDAWTALEGIILRALCDLGFPHERLPPRLRAAMEAHGTPRTLVQYKAGARVRVRDNASKRWVEGRILRPEDALVAGGGSAFEVQYRHTYALTETRSLIRAHARSLPGGAGGRDARKSSDAIGASAADVGYVGRREPVRRRERQR